MEATTLIEALDEMGADVHAYSGRAMFGRECVSVHLESEADLWRMANDLGLLNINVPAPRVDSLGRGIVAYWPSAKWPVEAA